MTADGVAAAARAAAAAGKPREAFGDRHFISHSAEEATTSYTCPLPQMITSDSITRAAATVSATGATTTNGSQDKPACPSRRGTEGSSPPEQHGGTKGVRAAVVSGVSAATAADAATTVVAAAAADAATDGDGSSRSRRRSRTKRSKRYSRSTSKDSSSTSDSSSRKSSADLPSARRRELSMVQRLPLLLAREQQHVVRCFREEAVAGAAPADTSVPELPPSVLRDAAASTAAAAPAVAGGGTSSSSRTTQRQRRSSISSGGIGRSVLPPLPPGAVPFIPISSNGTFIHSNFDSGTGIFHSSSLNGSNFHSSSSSSSFNSGSRGTSGSGNMHWGIQDPRMYVASPSQVTALSVGAAGVEDAVLIAGGRRHSTAARATAEQRRQVCALAAEARQAQRSSSISTSSSTNSSSCGSSRRRSDSSLTRRIVSQDPAPLQRDVGNAAAAAVVSAAASSAAAGVAAAGSRTHIDSTSAATESLTITRTVISGSNTHSSNAANRISASSSRAGNSSSSSRNSTARRASESGGDQAAHPSSPRASAAGNIAATGTRTTAVSFSAAAVSAAGAPEPPATFSSRSGGSIRIPAQQQVFFPGSAGPGNAIYNLAQQHPYFYSAAGAGGPSPVVLLSSGQPYLSQQANVMTVPAEAADTSAATSFSMPLSSSMPFHLLPSSAAVAAASTSRAALRNHSSNNRRNRRFRRHSIAAAPAFGQAVAAQRHYPSVASARRRGEDPTLQNQQHTLQEQTAAGTHYVTSLNALLRRGSFGSSSSSSNQTAAAGGTVVPVRRRGPPTAAAAAASRAAEERTIAGGAGGTSAEASGGAEDIYWTPVGETPSNTAEGAAHTYIGGRQSSTNNSNNMRSNSSAYAWWDPTAGTRILPMLRGFQHHGTITSPAPLLSTSTANPPAGSAPLAAGTAAPGSGPSSATTAAAAAAMNSRSVFPSLPTPFSPSTGPAEEGATVLRNGVSLPVLLQQQQQQPNLLQQHQQQPVTLQEHFQQQQQRGTPSVRWLPGGTLVVEGLALDQFSTFREGMLLAAAQGVDVLHESRGVSAQVLQWLPEERYDPRRGVALSDDSDARACNICMMKYEHNERLRRLPCLHAFHAECVGRWLQEHTSCPLCRFEVSQGLRWEWSSPMAAAGASSGSIAARGFSSAAADASATAATPVYSTAGGHVRRDAFTSVTSPAALAEGRARPRSGSTPAALSSPHGRSFSSSSSAAPASPSVSLAAASSSSAAAISSAAASTPRHVASSTAALASATLACSSTATEAASSGPAASSLTTQARQEQGFISVSSAASTAATVCASSSSPPTSSAPPVASPAAATSAALASQRLSRDAPCTAVSNAASAASHTEPSAAAVSSPGASAVSESPLPCVPTALLGSARQSAGTGDGASSASRAPDDAASSSASSSSSEGFLRPASVSAAASSRVVAHGNCGLGVNTSELLQEASRPASSVAPASSVSPSISVPATRLVNNSLSAALVSTSQSAGASTTTTSSLYEQGSVSMTSSSPEQYAAHVEIPAVAATVAARSCSSQSPQSPAATRSSSNTDAATTAAAADFLGSRRSSGKDSSPGEAVPLNSVHAGAPAAAAATAQAETSEILRTGSPALCKRRISTGDDRTLNRLFPGNSSFAVAAAAAGTRADATAARYYQEAGQQSPPCSSVAAAAAAALITAVRNAQTHQPEAVVKPSSRAAPRAVTTESAAAHPPAGGRRLSAGASGAAAETTRGSTKAGMGAFTMAATAAAASSSAATRPPAAAPSERRTVTRGCLGLPTSTGTQANQAGVSEGSVGRSYAAGGTAHTAGPSPAASGTKVANAAQNTGAVDNRGPLLAERTTNSSSSSATGAAARNRASSASAPSLFGKRPATQEIAAGSLSAAAAGMHAGDGKSCGVRLQQRTAYESSSNSSGAAPLSCDTHDASLLRLGAVVCPGTRGTAAFSQSPAVEDLGRAETSSTAQAAAASLQATRVKITRRRQCDAAAAAAAAAGGNETAVQAKSVEGVKHTPRPGNSLPGEPLARNSSLSARHDAASIAASAAQQCDAAAAEEITTVRGTTYNITAPAVVVQPVPAPRRASQNVAITKAATGSLSARATGVDSISKRTPPSVAGADFTCSLRRRSNNQLEPLTTAGTAVTVSEAAWTASPQPAEAGAVAKKTEENELHIDCRLSKDEPPSGEQTEQPRGQRGAAAVSGLDSKSSNAAAESHRTGATTTSRRRAAATRLSTAFRAISSTFAHLSPRTDRSPGNPRGLSPEAAATAGQPVHNAPATHRDAQCAATTTRLDVIPASNRSTSLRDATSAVSSVTLAEGRLEPTALSDWPRKLSPFSSSCPSIASEHVSLSPHRSAASSVLSGGTNSSRTSTPPSSADISPLASHSAAYRGTGAAAATTVATKTPHTRATAEITADAASLLRSAAADDASNLHKLSDTLVVHGKMSRASAREETVSRTTHTELRTAAEDGDTAARPPQGKPGAAGAPAAAEDSSQG